MNYVLYFPRLYTEFIHIKNNKSKPNYKQHSSVKIKEYLLLCYKEIGSFHEENTNVCLSMQIMQKTYRKRGVLSSQMEFIDNAILEDKKSETQYCF